MCAIRGRASDGRAQVPVRDDRAVELRAQRQVELDAGPTESGALSRAAGGNDDAESRREPHRLLTAPDRLASVVEHDVAERAPSDAGLQGERVAELVALRGRRPFLREGEEPVTRAIAAEVRNVLHDAGFLVVCLLDQERVVGDALGKRGRHRQQSEQHYSCAIELHETAVRVWVPVQRRRGPRVTGSWTTAASMQTN